MDRTHVVRSVEEARTLRRTRLGFVLGLGSAGGGVVVLVAAAPAETRRGFGPRITELAGENKGIKNKVSTKYQQGINNKVSTKYQQGIKNKVSTRMKEQSGQRIRDGELLVLLVRTSNACARNVFGIAGDGRVP
jgi:hypothetical protein